MTPQVIRLDPHHPSLGLLTPFYAQRVQQFAEQYQPEVKATEFASQVMSQLWLGNPGVLALGMVDDEARLVGHALASLEHHGTKSWVHIVQVRADQNVGDARAKAVEAVIDWARSLKVSQVLLSTNRDGKDWEKGLGFKTYRHVLKLPLLDLPPVAS